MKILMDELKFKFIRVRNTLRIFEVVHLWIILNRFIIGVIHIHAVISDHVESSNEQFHTGRVVGVLKSIERSPLREIRL